ncbi:heme NO-binding domain-containing protein [Jannaschia sp. Os4]|uniref:heme NO-binding domain-containing protein n=1 Tax=Jannaschia sp. Os4 TaxID=2807617 RepID=UPI00193A046E|nr:heme NO-binding domain-containing protein [Jannaschia sp. Os4]MBM2577897.1 heme NO-binding domain-containing protein [Jannaschia sp. Os4]
MHGTILKTAEGYLRATRGADGWAAIAAAANLPPDGIIAMRPYPDRVMTALLAAAASHTGRAPSDLLEDMGTWLCTDPANEAVRRLFRFTGPTFPDLLYSLDDVPERARMAVPDLDLPELSLVEQGEGRYRVASTWPLKGAGSVIVGVLRALADDYGALAVVAHEGRREARGFWVEMLSIRLLDEGFQDPKGFALGGAA